MGYIASWLSDQIQNRMADEVVEETLLDLKRREKILDEYIPFQTYSSRNFIAYLFDEQSPIASIIPYGAEIPATQVGTLRKIDAQMLKTALSYVYDEEKQWEMKEAMEQAALARLTVMDIRDPMTGELLIKGTNNDLAKYLFGSVEKVAAAQVEVLNVLTWQGLQFGKVEYVDPRSNYKTNLDYTNPHDTSYNHFPAALAGNDRWDQAATANGLKNLQDDVDAYVQTNGFRPDAIVMSRRLRQDLLNQTSTKQSAVALISAQVGTVGPDMLGNILNQMDLPPIVTFDEQYQSEMNSEVYRGRFLNDNRYVFLSRNMGKRAMGPTIEADGAEGVYVVTREVQKFPSIDATQGVATVLPAFTNPKLLFSRQVKDAA